MLNDYESDALLAQYLDFHYGIESYFGVPNYPAACAAFCLERHGEAPRERALDLGSGPGRTALELAREFAAVDANDLSQRFIDTARQLQQAGRVPFALIEEGDLTRPASASLHDMGLAAVAHRVTFSQGDATQLRPPTTGYDLVFAGNLIDRLAEPASFLKGVHAQVRPGGTLVIASPYTLYTEHTARADWIGGYRDTNGEPVTVQEGVRHHLLTHFEPIGPPADQPFVIRETRRKFQHTIAELSAWRRNA